MLVEKVIEVYLGKNLGFEAILDTLGFELILKDSDFH